MIDFYAIGSPNVVKIYIALEEGGALRAGRQALHAFPNWARSSSISWRRPHSW